MNFTLFLLLIAGSHGSIAGQARDDDNNQSFSLLIRRDVVATMQVFQQRSSSPSNRQLPGLVGKRKSIGVLKYLSDSTVEKSGNSESYLSVFGPLRTARDKKKSRIYTSYDYLEKGGPGSVSHFFAGSESAAQPSTTSINFVSTLSEKGASNSSTSAKGSGKNGKSDRPGTVSMLSEKVVSKSSTSAKGYGKSGKSKRPGSVVSGRPVVVTTTPAIISPTVNPSHSSGYGKGSGKGNGSTKSVDGSGKGSTGSSKSERVGKGGEGKAGKGGGMRSEKSSGKDLKRGKGGGKGKGKSRCNRFEFGIDRRRLQFDGADCDNKFLDVAARIPDLSTFLDLIEASGLSFMFSCAGPFTIAAPVNSAFEGIVLSEFSKRELKDIVLNHVFPSITLADDIEDGEWEALNKANVISKKDPLSLNDATPIQTDILGCNFVAHTIDALLVDKGR